MGNISMTSVGSSVVLWSESIIVILQSRYCKQRCCNAWRRIQERSQSWTWHHLPESWWSAPSSAPVLHAGNSNPLWTGSSPVSKCLLWGRGSGRKENQVTLLTKLHQASRCACLKYGWTAGRWSGTRKSRTEMLETRIQVEPVVIIKKNQLLKH